LAIIFKSFAERRVVRGGGIATLYPPARNKKRPHAAIVKASRFMRAFVRLFIASFRSLRRWTFSQNETKEARTDKGASGY
jgi:hypothetical protein